MFNWIDIEVRIQQREEYVRKLAAESLVDEIMARQEPDRRISRLAWFSLAGRFTAWLRCALARLAFAAGLSSRTPCRGADSNQVLS